MKAFEIFQFGDDGLRLTDRPDPKPGPHQVLLRMRAASLNYRDLGVRGGVYNPKLKLPIIPLSDGVGEVVEIGSEVTRVAVGDRVASIFFQRWLTGDPTVEQIAGSQLGSPGDGMLAELVVLHEDGVVPVPAHLTDEEAATLTCAGVTAWNALVQFARITAGQTVAIQGTGGVSLFALQFARMHGASVIATSSSDEKIERVKQLGAQFTVNYKQQPEWARPIKDYTSGRGVDLVVEVGGSETLSQSMSAVRWGGKIALIGVLSGRESNLGITPLLMRALSLQGIYVGSRQMFEEMNRAISLHQMRPIVGKVFPFEETPQAYAYMASAQHFGKIVIRIS